MQTESDILGILIECAESATLCELYYRKSVSRTTPHARLIEPYHLSTGKQDTLLRAFQVSPEEGWRSFMLHKIESAQNTYSNYAPRRNETISTAEIQIEYSPSPHWTNARKEYRDLICDALSDGAVDAVELCHLHECIDTHKMSTEDIRYVHASLYHRALGSILEDGFITDEERNEIRFLHRVFEHLGWCIGT